MRRWRRIGSIASSLLAQHYGFRDEELGFITKYDIKYRMGKELAYDA